MKPKSLKEVEDVKISLIYSKKFIVLLFLVLAFFMFEGYRHSIKGLMLCHQCDGTDNYCDADHKNNGGLGTGCFDPDGACYMRKHPDGQISKGCEDDSKKWMGPDGKPKCIKNQECYCNDWDFCNKDKNFGLDSGSVGLNNLVPAATLSYFVMAAVVTAF